MSLKRKFLICFLFVAVLAVSLIIFFRIFENQRFIAKIETKRYHSHLLGDELKQNSDDLTHMARTFVVTDNPRFREYFQNILEIYFGKAPRPKHYHSSYWDFVSATGQKPQTNGQPVAFETLIKKTDLKSENLKILRKAQARLEDLIDFQNQAINASMGLYQNEKGDDTLKNKTDKKKAVDLLYSQKHRDIRKKIKETLEDFFESINRETRKNIAMYQNQSRRLGIVIGVVMILSILFVLILLFPTK